jgi:hypothetical protein
MKLRKSALLIAALAFLFAWITPVVSLADDDMDVGDLSAILTTTVNSFNAGDRVYVDITLDGNTGVSVLDLNLIYDTDKLTFDRDSSYKAADFDTNDIVSITGGGGAISISLESGDGFFDNGEFITLVFDALQGDTEADVSIASFSYSDLDDNEMPEESDSSEDTSNDDSSSKDGKDSKGDSTKTNTTGTTGKSGSGSKQVSGTGSAGNSGKTAAAHGGRRTDKSYKTSDGLGNNIFLVVAVAAAAAGSGALFISRKRNDSN